MFYFRKNNYLEITRNIKEIVSIPEGVIDFLWKVLDCVLIGNVSDHNRCSWIITNIVNPNLINVPFILIWDLFWLIDIVLFLIALRMIINWLLIINCIGITFLNRLLSWKNTPNLRTLAYFLFMLINLINCLLKLFPFIFYSFRLNLA